MQNKASFFVKASGLVFFYILITIGSINAAKHAAPSTKSPAQQELPPQTKLVIVSDYYCPYACKPHSDREGMLVELARKAFAKHGIEIDYQIMSWEKALKHLQTGVIDGVFGANIDEIKARFPSVSQAYSQVAAFVDSDNNWFYDGIPSLSGRIIGLVDGYSYPLELKSYIYSNYLSDPESFAFSSKEDPVGDNIKKLMGGNISVYIEDENVLRDYATVNGVQKNIKNVGYISPIPTKIYIAFSRANPRSYRYAKIITDETISMKNSKYLKTLYHKYNIIEY